VLTRLATEPDALAQVARKALELMHYHPPNGPWTVDGLPALEVKRSDGSSICEAGCYQCLLSYFNQPDHEHINRRDPNALGLLVALANARVAPHVAPRADTATPAAPPVADDLHAQWLAALKAAGCRVPDEGPLTVLGGSAQMAAKYAATRTLVALQTPSPETTAALEERGWTLLDMSNPARWAQQFADHAALFN
jgi:hypothetical protein